MSSPIVSDPMRFAVLHSEGRGRVFLLSDLHEQAPQAEQVATVPSEVDLDTLVVALNDAAWSGRHEQFDLLAGSLPDAVVLSLRGAIERVRGTGEVLTGEDDVALSQISEKYIPYMTFTDDIAEEVDGAIDAAGVSNTELMFENLLEEEDRLGLRVCVFSGETSFEQRWRGEPAPGRERCVLEVEEFIELLKQNRAKCERFRAFTTWVPDDADPDTASRGVVMEYLGEMLAPEINFRVFVPGADVGEYDVLTERNRMVLWRALWDITVDLDGSLDLGHFEEYSSVYQDMPVITRQQPEAWWRRLEQSADALTEAARRGDFARLVPRTPGEEAIIALAASAEYWEAAKDNLGDHGYAEVFASLPTHECDDDAGEILEQLTGDSDVEMLWHADFAGIEDPADSRNRMLRVGDYRPSAWHTTIESREHLDADRTE